MGILRNMKNFIVTIDGPAGSGKTTIAREIALRLNWCILESGMLYRAVAWIMSGTDGPDARERSSMIAAAGAAAHIVIDGSPRSAELRTQAIGTMASILAADEEVRAILLPLQRAILKEEPNLIAEGRDMGTVVFPDADIKFFLTAALDVRAVRRQKELAALGFTHNLDDIIAETRQRDERDRRRKTSPLRPADNAIMIDTSELGIREVVAELLEAIVPRVRETQETELYETRFTD
jgi:cytidylate kinase